MSDNGDAPRAILDGRYRLGERIGRGGMADVFRAEDLLLGREVAVKLIRPGVDGVAAGERARGEVSALAALNHPSLVTLLDARLDGTEQEYLVMELVEGPTLSERIRTGAMPPDDVSRIAGEIAEALHVVHGAGIVHRDVKPSNVLLGPAHLPGHDFHAKLADFGIAYLVDSTRLTSPGMLIGTAAYLAPEQVNGSEPAPPADIYALGLVLLEALTGAPAFPHVGGVASAVARLNASPEIPAELGPEWTGLLGRMTRTEPAERPTALEVTLEVSRWVTGAHPVPLAAAPTAPIETSDPATKVLLPPPAPVAARRRRGLLVGAVAAGAAVLLGGGLFAATLAGAPTPTTTEPVVTEPTPASTTPSPSAPAPAATPVVVGTVDDDATEQAEKDAEKARKDAEKAAEDAAKAQEKADRDAQKQAEEEAAEQQEQDSSGTENEQPASGQPPAEQPPADAPPAEEPPTDTSSSAPSVPAEPAPLPSSD